ncbi:jg8716 [Pararge aegeria aegeria]|uniref:Jg8716 protein n=1 Tax=Pararge aegeria aegeria TaxID=348720 RepID=A0A8S4S5C8_9NEOP|nr:jg8716 [Pararge aegeria aegeria]
MKLEGQKGSWVPRILIGGGYTILRESQGAVGPERNKTVERENPYQTLLDHGHRSHVHWLTVLGISLRDQIRNEEIPTRITVIAE